MGEMIHKVSVRIADVTYTLISSEPEASIQRAVDAAERLVEAARAANPSLSLSASTVLALVNATGDRERLVDALAAGEEKLREAEAKITGLRREIGGLKEQNSILVREIRRNVPVDLPKPRPIQKEAAADAAGRNEELPPRDDSLSEDTAPAGAAERHTDGNITFVLDPRIMESEPEVAEQPEPEVTAQPEPAEHQFSTDQETPAAGGEDSSSVPQDPTTGKPHAKPFPDRLVQTGFDDLLPHG